MKLRVLLILTLLSIGSQTRATVFTGFSSETMDVRTVITIKADGSAALKSETVQPRAVAEQQIQIWDRYQRSQDEADGDGDTKPDSKESTEAPKPLTNEALATRLREIMQDRGQYYGAESSDDAGDINVVADKETVRISTSRSFSNLEELLKQGYSLWQSSGLAFENLRLEKDAEGRLRATFTPIPNARRYARNTRQAYKGSGTKEFKMVFPGKVLSSGFPQTEGNTTGTTIDPKKDETIDAAMKFLDGPIVVTAELGGLQLDQPLEAKVLQRQATRAGAAKSDLPITDAGPGFVAEPLSVTTTTVYYFPEGEKRTNVASMFGYQPAGMVVMAKFFAPKGRTLQSVSGVRVLSAKDDKGRPLTGSENSAAEGSVENRAEDIESFVYNSGGSSRGNSAQVQLRLDLPQADAQSIDELSAEAVAVTAGSWKEITFTNIQAGATNEMDLGQVLAGAKIAIRKFSNKNGQTRIQAQLKGPKNIRQLELQIKSTAQGFNSSINETKFNMKGAEASRNVTIQGYGFGENGQPIEGSVSLLVRYPEDVRRERVKFKLTALDLL